MVTAASAFFHDSVQTRIAFVSSVRLVTFAMAALPSVPAPSSPSASTTNASATLASAFGRGSRMSRIARRSGAASSLATGALTTWTGNNEKGASSPEHESGPNEQQQASLAKAAKWSALRREILPSPALMTVSAKVQHIIEYVVVVCAGTRGVWVLTLGVRVAC